MIRFKMMLFALVALCGVAASQPCHEDHTCFDGHFCDTASGYICRPCLRCKDLNREEPTLKNACVKSIGTCGPCLKDLVDSREGDLSCVPRSEGAPPPAENNSAVLWVIVVAGVAIVLIAAAFFIRYILRNTSIFKLHLDTNIGATLPTHVVATAPECPPPYTPPHAQDLPPPGEDTDRPLIKPYQPPFPEFESQDHQKGTVFNPPSYVRLPRNFNVEPPEPERGYNDVNDNYSPAVHDEDTTPSPWGPGANYTPDTSEPAVNGVTAGPQPQESAGAGDLGTALAAARNTSIIQPPQLTLRSQPMNSGDEPGSDDEMHSHNAHSGASRTQANGNYNVMNVNQYIIFKPPN